MNLHKYDLVIINSSGGKDSVCAMFHMLQMANRQQFSREKIVVSHQELGDMAWPGTKELVQQQADKYGLQTYFTKRRNALGEEETLLEYVERRGMWPSSEQRYCTSDFKRGPGARVVTALTKGMKQSRVLYVYGFRKQESTARAKKQKLTRNKRLTTKTRIVDDYLPIHNWTLGKVWKIIRTWDLPIHRAYSLGMKRFSCVFCVLGCKSDLTIAAIHNPELLKRYVALEEKIGHRFTNDFSMKELAEKRHLYTGKFLIRGHD